MGSKAIGEATTMEEKKRERDMEWAEIRGSERSKQARVCERV